MPESSDNLRSALRDMKSAATGAAANIGGNTLIVTNAPAGTRAAARLLAGTSAERPCGALLLGGAPVPDGIETFRADARCTGHNLATLRAATRWLRAGGVLVILRGPEGSAPLRSRVADARWGELVRRLAA